jgi:tRNA splicing endonuclease
VLNIKEYYHLYELGLGLIDDDEEKLFLTDFELAYAIENKLIKIDNIKFDDLIKGKENEYKVFKYLRDLGYIVRETQDSKYGLFLRSGKRGFRQGKGHKISYIIKVLKQDDVIKPLNIKEHVELSLNMKKSFIYAILDQDKPLFFGLIKMKFD